MNLAIKVQCSGREPTTRDIWVTKPFLLSESNRYVGVNTSKDFEVDADGIPTGNYRYNGFTQRTPEKVTVVRYLPKRNYTQIVSGSNINFIGTDGKQYKFRLSLWTKAWKDLDWDIQTWLANHRWTTWSPGFHGIRGIIAGSVCCEFKITTYPQNSIVESHNIQVDTQQTDWKFIKDYGYMCPSWKDRAWYAYDVTDPSPLKSGENIYFKFIGSKLYAKYSDELMPEIYDMKPGNMASLIEDYHPTISAKFKDNGHSGINPETFQMSISFNLNDTLNTILVDKDTSGLQINEQGFSFRPKQKLEIGIYTIDAFIEDNHLNQSTKKDWLFSIIRDEPHIINLKPMAGASVNNLRPVFSGEFVDYGASGMDLSSFELIIDGRNPIKQGRAGLVLTESGFSYTPSINLKPRKHEFSVKIKDNPGWETSSTISFTIASIPIHEYLGDLPLVSLSNLQKKYEDKYLDAYNGTITKVKDLSAQDPRELSDKTEIPLSLTIAHVKCAQLVCSQIRFNRMYFGELSAMHIWDIAQMTDEEILNYDMSEEEPETAGDIDELRENISMLYICLDASVLKELHLIDLIKYQPAGYYS